MALVTRMTRPTRPAAAAVSTVCAPRTLKARRVRASESGVRSKSACTTTSTPFRRPARAGARTSATRHVTPPMSPRWRSIAMTFLTCRDEASQAVTAGARAPAPPAARPDEHNPPLPLHDALPISRHAPDVAPLAIDRDDLLDVPRRGEPGGYGGSDAARRPGYRHHGHRLMTRGAALGANRPPGVCHSVPLPRRSEERRAGKECR